MSDGFGEWAGVSAVDMPLGFFKAMQQMQRFFPPFWHQANKKGDAFASPFDQSC
jgi:hypothetical protein